MQKTRHLLTAALGLAITTSAMADSVTEWGPWANESLEGALIASGADITELLEPTAAGPGAAPVTGGTVTPTTALANPAVTPEGLPGNPADLVVPAGPTLSFADSGHSGVIRGQAIWPSPTGSDIDLHLLTPDGGHVSYWNTSITLRGGGTATLDHDNTTGAVDDPARNAAVENIYVNPPAGGTLPSGYYYFVAHAFDEATGSGTPVTVVVTGDGGATSLSGTQTLQDGELTDLYRITYDPNQPPEYARIPLNSNAPR